MPSHLTLSRTPTVPLQSLHGCRREIYSCWGSISVAPSHKSFRPTPSFEVVSKDTHNLSIRALIEAIHILGSEKVDVLRENLMSDLRNRMQSQIESVPFERALQSICV